MGARAGSKSIGVKHSLAVTSSFEKKTYGNKRYNNSQNYSKNASNQQNRPYTEKLGCLFCGERGHDFLFKCEKFKVDSMTNRCRYISSLRLCWYCLETGHVAMIEVPQE